RLVVRVVAVLSAQAYSGRLVGAVRLVHGFGRRGGPLQACQFLPASTRGAAKRRPCFGAQRNRAPPQTAEIVYGAFVSRLSHWHRGYWDLGLWGPAGPTDLLSPSRAFRSGMDDGDISTVNEEKQRCSLP